MEPRNTASLGRGTREEKLFIGYQERMRGVWERSSAVGGPSDILVLPMQSLARHGCEQTEFILLLQRASNKNSILEDGIGKWHVT